MNTRGLNEVCRGWLGESSASCSRIPFLQSIRTASLGPGRVDRRAFRPDHMGNPTQNSVVSGGVGRREAENKQTQTHLPGFSRARAGPSRGTGGRPGWARAGELLPGKGQCLALTRLSPPPVPGLRTRVPMVTSLAAMDRLKVLLKDGLPRTSQKPSGGEGYGGHPPRWLSPGECVKMQLPGPALPKLLLQTCRDPGIQGRAKVGLQLSAWKIQ